MTCSCPGPVWVVSPSFSHHGSSPLISAKLRTLALGSCLSSGAENVGWVPATEGGRGLEVGWIVTTAGGVGEVGWVPATATGVKRLAGPQPLRQELRRMAGFDLLHYLRWNRTLRYLCDFSLILILTLVEMVVLLSFFKPRHRYSLISGWQFSCRFDFHLKLGIILLIAQILKQNKPGWTLFRWDEEFFRRILTPQYWQTALTAAQRKKFW